MKAENPEQKAGYESVRQDFEVKYRFLKPEEGGRRSGLPYQNYRSDWLYEGDDISDGIYMIWPIFLDGNGNFIDAESQVPMEGTAQMYIVNEELRKSFHAKRLRPGVRGYFMEGPNRVAEAVVTRLLAISEDIQKTDAL